MSELRLGLPKKKSKHSTQVKVMLCKSSNNRYTLVHVLHFKGLTLPFVEFSTVFDIFKCF